MLIAYEEICQILYQFYMSNQRHLNLQLLICYFQTHLASGEVRDHMNLINERIKHERLRVCVFPEGTRNKAFDGKMLPFKKGNVFISLYKVEAYFVPVSYFMDTFIEV